MPGVVAADVQDGARSPDARAGNDDTTPHDDWVVGRAGWNEEALDWLNHYLRGEDFAYEVNEKNLVEAQDQLGQWRTEAQYPSTDVVYREFPIPAGTYVDEADTNGYWTVTQPIAAGEEFRITGESIFEFDVDISVPGAQFVGVLYDVLDGQAEEISRSMYRIEESGTITFKSDGSVARVDLDGARPVDPCVKP